MYVKHEFKPLGNQSKPMFEIRKAIKPIEAKQKDFKLWRPPNHSEYLFLLFPDKFNKVGTMRFHMFMHTFNESIP